MRPLQQSQGEAQVTIHPGPNGHGTSGVIEALSAIPIENIGIGFMTVAGQASGDAIFGDAQATAGTGENVINRFRRFAAINATFTSINME